MKKALITVGLAAALGGSPAPAQAARTQPATAAAPQAFCLFYDSTPYDNPWEQMQKAVDCLKARGFWVNGSGMRKLAQINRTASRWEMLGGTHPRILVDWDSAREWGHAAGYGVYVN